MRIPVICFSLVLFKHSFVVVKPLIDSIAALSRSSSDFKIILSIYDGSPASYACPTKDQFTNYLQGVDIFYEKGSNIGYGSSNNRNFYRSFSSAFDVFVVVNPDIYFMSDKFLPLIHWILADLECTCAAPLVLLPDGSIQYSAKHNPTFLSLLIGRFQFLRRISFFYRYDSWHRNLGFDYNNSIIPSTYLSGCLLVIPAWAFEHVGGFCDKYFLHVEDADLVRRLSLIGKTLHNPSGVVVHRWARGSHSSFSQILSLLKSYLVYCFIWGFRFF